MKDFFFSEPKCAIYLWTFSINLNGKLIFNKKGDATVCIVFFSIYFMIKLATIFDLWMAIYFMFFIGKTIKHYY